MSIRTVAAALAFLLMFAAIAVAQPTPAPAPAPSPQRPTPGAPGQPPPSAGAQPGQRQGPGPGPGMQPERPPGERTIIRRPGGERGERGEMPRPRPGPGPAVVSRDQMPPAAVPQGELHQDVVETAPSQKQPWLALCFWLFALVAVGGALFVISRRNLIAAVMGMVGAFFGIAATYMMLYATFLAVIQLLVYAGAIMVLFVFVIMILNRPEDEPWGPVGMFGKGLAGLGLAYLTYRLVVLLWNVNPTQSKVAALAPQPIKVQVANSVVEHEWGSTGATGTELFGHYLFPFEAISILLLVSVVGAIAVARPLKPDEGVPPPEGAP